VSIVPNAQYDDLEKLINDSLQKACAHKDKLRRTGTRCTITNIIFSALATFVAGSAVIFPALVGTNWRITCAVAGACALSATIVGGLQKQLADPEILVEASECCGKLKSLKLQTMGRKYDWETVRTEYGQIIASCQRVDC
jgi:hypothetical protein